MKIAQKTKFATFFPSCENIHLIKDVGMIPYILNREFSYDSYVITYNNDVYSNLNNETPGLKLSFLKKLHPPFLDSLIRNLRIEGNPGLIFDSLAYFSKNRNNIDIFQVYHLSKETLVISLIFRLLNKKSKIYLKFDANLEFFLKNHKNQLQYKLKNYFYKVFLKMISFDVMSVETEELYKYLILEDQVFKKFKKNLYFIPNGVDPKNLVISQYENQEYIKEDIILHVGRLGSYPKATEVVLEIFSRIAEFFPQWKLVLIGQMEDSFINTFKKFLIKSENIKNQIEYTGFISDRDKIFNYYQKSKILFQPSKYESFGLAAIEGGILGCVLIGSNINSFYEITNHGEYGYLCPVNDLDCFLITIKNALENSDELRMKSICMRKQIMTNYNWCRICGKLDKIFISLK